MRMVEILMLPPQSEQVGENRLGAEPSGGFVPCAPDSR
jgi:hypothetical protein